MKKIFFLHPTLNVGGAEKMAYEIVRHLDRTRFRLKVCCLYGPGSIGQELINEGIELNHGLMKSKYDLYGAYRLFQLLKKESPDLLFAENSPLVLFWGFICARILNVPRIATVIHATMKPDRRVRFKKDIINRFILHRLDKIGVVSNAKLKSLVKKYNLKPEKIVLIPNGIDIAKFTDLEQRNGLKQEIGISEGDKIIGMVGRLVRKKGHDVLLKSAKDILVDFPNAKFLIIGDGEERASLEKLVTDLGIGESVIFLGERKDIADLISLFDIAVLCSRDESLPVALLEYTAVSKPIVATNVGGNSEIIVDTKSGFLVPPDNPKALAIKIIELLKNEKKGRIMGRLARKIAEDKFSLEQMMGKMERFFMDCISNGEKYQRRTRVIMVGPRLDVKGGISSFAKYCLKSELVKKFHITYLSTATDGSKILKSFFFLKSVVIFLAMLALDRNIKIVHIFTASRGSFYRKAAVLLLSKLFMKKTIFHIEAGGFDVFYNYSHAIRRFCIRKALDFSDIIVVLSKTWLLEVSKMTRNQNIKIIPNSVDADIFKSISINRKHNGFNVLTLGRLEWRKGTYDILDIVPFVLKEVPNAKFYLAGDGELENVKKLCLQKGIEKNVILLGWLYKDRLLEELENASVFLLPSYHEGLPVALLEAMASGLAVVSTRVGGIPEVVEDGKNGFLTAPGQKQELGKRIIELLKDKRLRKGMGVNNINKIDSMFRLDRVINKFFEVYRDLLSGDGKNE